MGKSGDDLRFGRVPGGVILEPFPLADEVADLPHQCGVAVDRLLGFLAIVVEAWSGHRRFELLDVCFASGDARLELRDALPQRLGRFLLLAALGLVLLARFAGVFRLWARGPSLVRLGCWSLSLAIWAVSPAPCAFAQVGQSIVEVVIEQEGRPVDDRLITSLIKTTVGEPLSMRDVRETVTHLMTISRYEDVQAR